MDLSAREDVLEAVLICTLALNRPPAVAEVNTRLKDPLPITGEDLDYLIKNGDITLNADGTIVLTGNGRTIAERVLKKHRVLQCFLHEMLGMDNHTASDEACVLEHDVSDHTIERLGDYIDSSGKEKQGKKTGTFHGLHFRQRTRQGIGTGKHNIKAFGDSIESDIKTINEPVLPAGGNIGDDLQKTRVLSDMQEKDRCMVAGILPGGDLHRLIDLGIIPGEEVFIRRKLRNNAVVIQVKGCDIALSPEIAATILVENPV
ncbi:MAG TPA: metal-dependent transcriptional regulator [Methanoregulaceae archaeon]|nr:metal-dependent transcriptional regulator [Methanoregulaceae archaeon]